MAELNEVESYLLGDWYINLDYGLKNLIKYQSFLANKANGSVDFDKIKGLSAPRTALLNVDMSEYLPTSEGKKVSIAKISFSGPMISEPDLCTDGIQSVIDELKAAYADDSIGGILLEFNTGGGEVSAAIKMRAAVQDKNKPVVVLSNGFASAGVYSVLDADERIATSKLAKFGSIGVLVSLNSKAIEYIKENVITIYSKYSDNKNKAHRDILEGDFETLKADISALDKVFMSEVNEALSLDPSTKEETLSGGMFLAEDAKKRGLLDAIGGESMAIRRLLSIIKNS